MPLHNPTDVATIQTVTDNLPDSGALTSIAQQATLEDVEAETEEVDQHFHNVERWWGAVAVPGETNAIEANVTRPFAARSGDDTWCTAIPICGTDDTPVPSPDDAKHDCHRIIVTDLDNDTTPWRFRIIWGSGTSADAITADQWTESVVMTNASPGNRAGGSPADVIARRINVGTKLWAQSWNATNGEILSFFWGTHGYPG